MRFVTKTPDMVGGEYDFAEKVFIKDGALYGAMHLYDGEVWSWKLRDLTPEEVKRYA